LSILYIITKLQSITQRRVLRPWEFSGHARSVIILYIYFVYKCTGILSIYIICLILWLIIIIIIIGLWDGGGFFIFEGKSTVSDVIIAPSLNCLKALVYLHNYTHILCDVFLSLLCLGSDKIQNKNYFHYHTRVRVASQFCITSTVGIPYIYNNIIQQYFLVFICMY